MRVANSLKNLKAGIIGQVITVFSKFILRTFFIYFLGNEYLGINSLFGNILTILSLAEMGLGTAISYSLYAPLAKNDEEKTIAIMAFFQKSYYVIGGVITITGILITPFLGFFVKELPDIPYIELIFFLFIINTSSSYFFSYKTILIIAAQHNYTVLYNRYICSTLCIISQIIVLVFWKKYLLYLIIQVAFTIIENMIISYIADKKYPFLKRKSNNKLDRITYKQIKDNVVALLFHKIGSVIVFSTDNILLSKFFGIVIVGMYSNYTLITSSVEGIMKQFFVAISASVGNLGVTEDKEKQIKMFDVLFMIDFWIYTFSAACIMVLINPFVALWLGEDYVLNFAFVIVSVINFYLTGMRNSVQTFKEAYGLYKQNQWMPIPESLINLSASILLAKIIGPIGILIGTTISSILTCVWIEPWVLFRYGFGKNSSRYMLKYLKFAGISGLIIAMVYVSSQFVTLSGFFGLTIKLLYCIISVNLLLVILFFRTEEMRYMCNLLQSLFGKSSQ